MQNDDFFDALVDAPDIRPVVTRHEQGAAYMAMGAAQVTGGAGCDEEGGHQDGEKIKGVHRISGHGTCLAAAEPCRIPVIINIEYRSHHAERLE